ncbi:MAG: hypothetical protein ACK44D_00050 [Bacteroidia bacterium]
MNKLLQFDLKTLLGYFLALLLLAAYFCNERILNVDTSFHFFNIINTKWIWVAENRFGTFFSQIPLVAAIYFKLPMWFLVNIYSLSFIFIYFSLALFCFKFLQNKAAAISILLVLILGVKQSFFHPVTETHQALVYSVFLHAWISYSGYRANLKHIVTVLLIGVCAVTHPVSLFAVFFVIGFWILNQKKWLSWEACFLIGTAICIYALKLWLTPSGYDSNQYNNLITAIPKIVNLHQLYPVKFIANRLTGIYLAPFIIWLFVNIVYLKHKQVLMIIFINGSFFLFSLMSVITFSAGDSDAMMEKSFMPGIFMLVVAFTHILFNTDYINRLTKVTTFVGLHLFLTIGLVGFYKEGKIFNERITYLKEVVSYIRSTEKSKVVVASSNLNKQQLLFSNWAFAIDVLVLSVLDDVDKPCTAFIGNGEKYLEQAKNSEKIFLCVPFWPIWQDSLLNKTYFKFPTQPYYFVEKNIKI